jgi:hypothetical protein
MWASSFHLALIVFLVERICLEKTVKKLDAWLAKRQMRLKT